jgi:transcriptional regulator with XRE-family HTH domain
MLILPRQIRAARALLDWTTEDLAVRVGMSKSAVSYIESGKNKPSGETREAMYRIFSAEGIVFTPFGVELRDNPVMVLQGENLYQKSLLEAAARLSMTAEAEILFHCADELGMSEEVADIEKSLRARGIALKKTVADDVSAIGGDVRDYRLIPKAYVEKCRMITMIYGDYVVLDLGDGLMRIRSQKLSQVFRAQFEYWWSQGKEFKA